MTKKLDSNQTVMRKQTNFLLVLAFFGVILISLGIGILWAKFNETALISSVIFFSGSYLISWSINLYFEPDKIGD